LDRTSEILKAVDGLSLKETKLTLKHILLQTDIARNNEEMKTHLLDSLAQLYDNLIAPKPEFQVCAPDTVAERVHIVFGDSMGGSLKYLFKSMGLVNTDQVIAIPDLLSIGPIAGLHEEAGHKLRCRWFSEHINFGDTMDGYDFGEYCRESLEQIAQIPNQATAMIWSSSNAHEQAGLRFAAYLLREKENQVIVCNPGEICNRRYNTEDYRIDYRHSGEISIEKLQAVYEEATSSPALTLEARKNLEQEWLILAEQQEVLRIWKNGVIHAVDADYLDAYILETLEELHRSRGDDEFIKAAEIIGQAYGQCDQYISDMYYECRLRHLIYNGELEIKGVPKAMRYYSVRRRWPEDAKAQTL
jgi:hypothetical protein